MLEIAYASHFLSVQNDLGEDPLWHPNEKRLYWVDIEVGRIHRHTLSNGTIETFTIGTSVGAFGFRQKGGLILATGKGFALWNEQDQKIQILTDPVAGKPGVRLNDGKVDDAGRFWAGSHDPQGQGALYRLDPDGTCHTMWKNVTISNGLAWSLDKNTFYYTDSGDYAIYTFNHDPQSGVITNRQVFLQLPQDHSQGVPDGLTIDVEGCIWSARWDGGKVVRYSPSGEALLEIILPVSRVTSVTFGGPRLNELFITTASTGLNPQQRKKEPLAGDIFVYKTNTRGLKTPYFSA